MSAGGLAALGLLLVAAFAPQTDFGVRAPPGAIVKAYLVSKVVRDSTKTAGVSGAFSCQVATVTDGDTFRCADGTRIRLSAIDAPEMPGSCRPGRSCAPGDPYKAKDTLSRLAAGRTVRCEAAGKSYNRLAAWCSAGGKDLSCAMVRSGHAIRLPQFDRQGRLCRS